MKEELILKLVQIQNQFRFLHWTTFGDAKHRAYGGFYERDKDRFICQAKTLEELATLSLKYENVKYAAVLHGDNVVAFVNGEVKVTI